MHKKLCTATKTGAIDPDSNDTKKQSQASFPYFEIWLESEKNAEQKKPPSKNSIAILITSLQLCLESLVKRHSNVPKNNVQRSG